MFALDWNRTPKLQPNSFIAPPCIASRVLPTTDYNPLNKMIYDQTILSCFFHVPAQNQQAL